MIASSIGWETDIPGRVVSRMLEYRSRGSSKEDSKIRFVRFKWTCRYGISIGRDGVPETWTVRGVGRERDESIEDEQIT